MAEPTPIIRTEGLTKHFGNVRAVEDVDFEATEGEIMAIVGDNGAGKSTLIEMLCGVLEPTAGEIFVRDEPVDFDDYNEARNAGITTVYQDLALAPSQIVAANVFLGNEPLRDDLLGKWFRVVDREYMIQQSREALDRVRIPVDPEAKISNVSGGQQQAVAIARALQFDPEILIMDEPTSALSIDGVKNVLNVITTLRNRGLTILLISHNIEEVLAVADRITVLSQGRLMGVREAETASREEIVSMMMGGKDDSAVDDLRPGSDLEESTA